MRYKTLNNNVVMPQVGFGVFKIPNDEAEAAVTHALEAGYRSIDTASYYENEEGVGRALQKSSIPREDLFITTKLWNHEQGYEEALHAFERSRERLGLEYIDLYLIHWPAPANNKYVETYQALEKLYADGKVKAIGVSNFQTEHLDRLLAECSVTPVLNQVECHPYFAQEEIKNYCRRHDIFVEAWGPIMQGGEVLKDSTILSIAEAHGKTPAQVILRWHLQNDTIIIPKSVTPHRIKENLDLFDFELSEAEMNQIVQLDKGARQGRHPLEVK
ncbi:aldo/keto reductase [Halobacillus salinarum]|uniref:Aldo/keto reductase n=1 Tax=Halobacillus salinarum TaxID=2932257 RepID=A0ABY4ELS0_9BACI|nr:aldo/keto reductase [Halobacillus salinarum]UOQ44945.1 aldo/keto reductase [Halobacillus salinarum]